MVEVIDLDCQMKMDTLDSPFTVEVVSCLVSPLTMLLVPARYLLSWS